MKYLACLLISLLCACNSYALKTGDIIVEDESSFCRKILCEMFDLSQDKPLRFFLVSTNMDHAEAWKWCTEYELRNYRKVKKVPEVKQCPKCQQYFYL